MNVIRPCLACGLDNVVGASDCARCGVPLRAHAAAAAPAMQALPVQRGRLTGLLLPLLLVAAAAGAGAWWLAHRAPDEIEASLRWEDPLAVGAWAKDFLGREAVPPSELRAELSSADRDARKVLLSVHPQAQPLPLVVRAAARLLLAARAAGPGSAAHVAVVQHGESTLTVPVGEAADLAGSAAALARRLGLTEDELGLPLEGAASAEAAEAETGAELPGPVAASPSAPAEAGLAGGTAPAPPAESGPAAPASAAATSAPIPATASAPSPATASASAPAAAGGIAARIARGMGPVVTRAEAGASTVALRLQVAAGARRRVTLRSLTVKASGSLADVEDIAFVDLKRESDLSGRGAARAETLGSRQSFADEDGTVTFDGLLVPFGEDGLPLALTVHVELAADVSGGSLELSVPAATDVVLEDSTGAPVAVAGGPVKGPRITVEGNLAPDPEQQRLDELADAGPDAVDPNLDRLKQEALDAARARASAPAPASAAAPASAPAPR